MPGKRKFQLTLKSLLLVIFTVCLGLGWWLPWPVKTATTFHEALCQNDLEEIERLTGKSDGGAPELLSHDYSENSLPDLVLKSRSWRDVLQGKQDFTMGKSYRGVALRGRIVRFGR